jgi:polyhydroxyalkanoate synthesis repressor PhaR
MNQMPASDSSAGEGETARIVRYPNRRFYDRSQAKYVTLQEIAAMIRGGKNVSVRDSKTNDDLTSTTLTQIILDQHPERMGLLPVPVLHMMIRTNDVVLGLLREYFRQSLAYLDFWQRASALTPLTAPMKWLNTLLPGGPAASAPPPASTAEESPTVSASPLPVAALDAAGADLLLRRIAEMERRLNTLDSGRPDSNTDVPETQSGMSRSPARHRSARIRGQRQKKK